jgi:hypothetical protein
VDKENETQLGWPLVIVLTLVLFSFIIYRRSNPLSTTRAEPGEDVAGVSNTPAASEVNKPGSPGPGQKQKLSNPDGTETVPRIEAIFISGSGKSGIFVRGNFAREGDIVDGFRILKIYQDKVEYEKDGKTITGVFLPPETGKTKSRQSGNKDSGPG